MEAQPAKKVGYLNFSNVQTKIDISFWLKFTQLKLDEWKLDSPMVDIFGVISLPMNNKVGSDLTIDEDGFKTDEEQAKMVTTGGLLEFKVPGKFIHFNTIEEYQAFDETAPSFVEMAQKENATNFFVLVCFGDLKNYDFYYKILLKQNPEKIETIKGKKLGKEFTKEQLKDLFGKAIHTQIHEKKDVKYVEQDFFVAADGSQTKTLAEAEYLVFYDNMPLHPSVLINNVLQRVQIEFRNNCGDLESKVLKIVLAKDKISKMQDVIPLDGSFYCEVVLTKNAVLHDEPKLFLELSNKKINLKDQLDTKKIVENAADLNLKLMKWRQVPELNLDVLQKTSCLLLGSGSLGCQVARNLVSWGYRKITFVDAGKVSYSNPVRQCLFTYEDSIKPDNFKAPIAADRLREVFPMVETRGETLKIPMPGHAVGNNEEAIKEVHQNMARLEELVKEHDVVFLLTDSRESRWLPTVLAGIHNKICLTVALGFETYLVMRHGMSATVHNKEINGERLGCYFCNDVIAPRNSLQDRSLDQQCTVSRPALCCMASALGVELLTSLLNHPLKHGAKAREVADQCDKTSLGILPQQLRGDLSNFSNTAMYGECFDKCIGCALKIAEAYQENREDFLIKACNKPDYLEDLTGITAMNEAINMDDIEALSDVEWD